MSPPFDANITVFLNIYKSNQATMVLAIKNN